MPSSANVARTPFARWSWCQRHCWRCSQSSTAPHRLPPALLQPAKHQPGSSVLWGSRKAAGSWHTAVQLCPQDLSKASPRPSSIVRGWEPLQAALSSCMQCTAFYLFFFFSMYQAGKQQQMTLGEHWNMQLTKPHGSLHLPSLKVCCLPVFREWLQQTLPMPL